MTAKVGSRVSYEDMANPLRQGSIVGDIGHSWLIVWDRDLETGAPSTWREGGVEIAFSSSVTKHMLAAAAERQQRFAEERRGVRCGGWNLDEVEPRRTVLVHLNVEVPAVDERNADEIGDAILAALEVGLEGEPGDLASGSTLTIGSNGASVALALVEEV